ncbi:MAG: NUDIX domain-containing protein [Kiritimatiellae bacterium]|nr:NUDIX domain-containing protein [Kiritimatiellia bacterium]MDW8458504.1 NUDIX domain-containing protein [Verrucomicrobiota bacterium]
MDEYFDIVDREGRIVGRALRSECHGNPALIHQAVHVQVFDQEGRLFLQKRASSKDIEPGKWDSSVGGHLRPGESPREGAQRELEEELGVRAVLGDPAYSYLWQSPQETELVRTFVMVHPGPFRLQASELEDGRFWTMQEIEELLVSGLATLQFAYEFPMLRDWLRRSGKFG